MSYKYPFLDVDEELKYAVWNKGFPIDGIDPAYWRKDICGNTMKFNEHGNPDSCFGWEIDHIIPRSQGGSDDLSNLQPLYWINNREKCEEYPWRYYL